MRFNYPFLIILIFACSLISTSCQAIPTSAVVELTQIAPVETAVTMPVPTLTATVTSIMPTQMPTLIKTFEVYPIQSFFSWWSIDSSKLYYERNGTWEFDIITGTSNKTQAPRPETLRCPYLPDISNGILLFQQECSPSREKIIYYTIQDSSPQALSPIPAPSDCNEGICPGSYEGSPVDMWVSENGEVHKVGQLISCVKDHKWAEDEQKLIAVGYDSDDHWAPISCNNYAWLVDLSKNQITPLLSKADHPGKVFVHDYSPDGNFLLYTEHQNLYLLDVQTQDTTDLEVLREVDNAWWLNEHKILVLFHLQTGGYNMGWGILDLESGKFTELLNESNTIGEYVLNDPKVSPDEKWMTFTAFYPGKGSFGFWVMSLEIP